MKSEFINNVVEKRGMDWLLAAVARGTVRYSELEPMRLIIDKYKQAAKKSRLKQFASNLKRELVAMVEFFIQSFEDLCKSDPDMADAYIAFVKEMM